MPCAWAASEFLLKASLMDKEDLLLRAWVRGYMHALECFPRLHVITGQELLPKARAVFASVPNATVRENAWTPALAHAGTYHIIQWHCFWADNFTSAPYVFCAPRSGMDLGLRTCVARCTPSRLLTGLRACALDSFRC